MGITHELLRVVLRQMKFITRPTFNIVDICTSFVLFCLDHHFWWHV